MNAKVFNLLLMFFWLAIFLSLLTRELWMPPAMLDKISGPHTPLAMALIGLLILWNGMRFWAARQSGGPPKESPTVNEYRRRIRAMGGEEPKVTNPEFAFDDSPPDEPRRT
jgi:hypothetical protein